MNSNSIIVQEYLGSLKEDKELDYLFPILINSMGFRIVQTAKESKGQSQYGKDIIAIGKDYDGIKKRWYFELKGFKDKDITDKNYSTTDGIRESIIEAKDTAFNDSTIPQFNTLPIKIVLVHNGVLKTNIRPTFDGFISKEFKEGEFERWDIYYLTDLFSQHLFSEYLLSDNESNRLFKKTLAFLDTPDYDYQDFKTLVKLQFEKTDIIRGRVLPKLFATLGLLESIIFHYSIENKNLIPSKECSKILVLYTWSWILDRKLEKRKAILKEFKKLLNIQFEILNLYFKKTFPIAKIKNGLFYESALFFEKVGYPLRCFDYLEDIIYFCRLRNNYPYFQSESKHLIRLKNKQKDLLIELITNNSGFYRPLLDNHSIGIIQLFLFFSDKNCLRQKDINFLSSYIFIVINNIIIEKLKHNRLPELSNNVDLVIEAVASSKKPDEYCDASSILIATILEILVIFNSEDMYQEFRKYLDEDLSLQIVSINFEEYNVEQLLFEKHLHNEYYVDCMDELPDNFEEFKIKVKSKKVLQHIYRTDNVGFSFLRYLAHSYFKNEILPDEWRNMIK
jgi:hypothetical protein